MARKLIGANMHEQYVWYYCTEMREIRIAFDAHTIIIRAFGTTKIER